MLPIEWGSKKALKKAKKIMRKFGFEPDFVSGDGKINIERRPLACQSDVSLMSVL